MSCELSEGTKAICTFGRNIYENGEWDVLEMITCENGDCNYGDQEPVDEEPVDEEPVVDIVEEVVEDVVVDIVEEVVEDVVEDIVEDVVEDIVEEVVEDVVEDIVEEPVVDIVEEVVEDVVVDWANAAFQVAGRQEDYDRVMNADEADKKAIFEELESARKVITDMADAAY
jgi:hypothetical protein